MNLTLVGYRGSGKSTIGALLAKRLGWTFCDLDALIVQRAGRSIAQIFKESGESDFRRLEREACLALRKAQHTVLALGGGALADPDIRTLVGKLGKVVWLRVPAAVLWGRINGDAKSSGSRPDLTAEGGLPEVEAMLKRRDPLYRSAADHVIDTFPGTPDDTADAIELWHRADDAPRRTENSLDR